MARQDRSFTSRDIIRFYHQNLTDAEATAVFDAICSRKLDLVPDPGTVEFWGYIRDLIDMITKIVQPLSRVPGSVGAASRLIVRSLGLIRAFLSILVERGVETTERG